MKLNLNGNCQKSFFIAVGFSLFALFALIIPRTNEFADIPEIEAANTVLSNKEIFTVRKGEAIRIIGAQEFTPQKHKKGDKKKELMLSVQNSKGERDFFLAADVITEEQLQEIMPELKHHNFSNKHGVFNRRTLSEKEFSAIQTGMTVPEVEAILYPEERLSTVDGYLTGKYDKVDVFVKADGRFKIPIIKFKDGKVCDIQLEQHYKTHQNAWLLKSLPGTEWIYSHNIFNSLSQKKSFGNSKYKGSNNIELNTEDGVLSKIVGYLILIVIALVVFAFYLIVPAVPAMISYGALVFPGVVRLFDDLRKDIVMGIILVAGFYYAWIAFMPYVAWWILLPVMVCAINFFMEYLFGDSLCVECGFMNCMHFDHTEFVREYDTSRNETKSHVTGRRKGYTKTGTLVTEADGYQHEENVRYKTHTETDYHHDNYDVSYHVKEYNDFYKCSNCGHITIRPRTERQETDRRYLGSSHSTSTNDEVSYNKPY